MQATQIDHALCAVSTALELRHRLGEPPACGGCFPIHDVCCPPGVAYRAGCRGESERGDVQFGDLAAVSRRARYHFRQWGDDTIGSWGLGDTPEQVAAFRVERDMLFGYLDAAHQETLK